ncbi:MAG: uroporphyrinogen decarboxylase family protein [Planctomycetota bacterium]|nr:uroporphyrinogen decarboxylase family protein [Planctomycetota bacterium]
MGGPLLGRAGHARRQTREDRRAAWTSLSVRGRGLRHQPRSDVRPRVFSRLLAPRLRAISEACRTHGCKHLFGSDGNLWPLADALFDGCGMDGYYEIDRGAGMDLRQLRERFPRLTLMGNISSRTLHLGTVEEVAAETRNVLEEARELGGVIVGVSNQVVPQSPPENLLAMLETLHANC